MFLSQLALQEERDRALDALISNSNSSVGGNGSSLKRAVKPPQSPGTPTTDPVVHSRGRTGMGMMVLSTAASGGLSQSILCVVYHCQRVSRPLVGPQSSQPRAWQVTLTELRQHRRGARTIVLG
jgi:hypothetical protein